MFSHVKALASIAVDVPSTQFSVLYMLLSAFTGSAEKLSNCGGCLLNAAWTYITGACLGADGEAASTWNTTGDIASIFVASHSVSTISKTNGKCCTIIGSAVNLEAAELTLDVKYSRNDNGLSQSAASAIVGFLGFIKYVCNALIATPSASVTPSATATSEPSGFWLVSLRPVHSFPISTAAAANSQKDISPERKTRVVFSVLSSLLGFLAVIYGVFLLLRHWKKGHLLKRLSNEPGTAESRTSFF